MPLARTSTGAIDATEDLFASVIQVDLTNLFQYNTHGDYVECLISTQYRVYLKA